MASPGSFIRSAAQATSSAYRRLPIRWRLAGGSALLTLVILLGFATIVGVLTTRQINSDFNRQITEAATELQASVRPRQVLDQNGFLHYSFDRLDKNSPDLDDYVAGQSSAVIRLVSGDGEVFMQTEGAPFLPPPLERIQEFRDWRIESRPVELEPARRLLRPVRAQAVGHRGDHQPRTRVPRARRARRRGARPARRARHGDARDGPDHAAHRRGERDRAHPRPVRADPASGVARRGLRAGADARAHAPGARRGARARRRRRWRASASSSRTRRTSCARR